MPAKFDKCVKFGGKVRTKSLKGDKYLHVCIPKGSNTSVAGEVKQKKSRRK